MPYVSIRHTLETIGNPVPIVADAKTTLSGSVAVGRFSVSSGGTLVYRRSAAPLGPTVVRNQTQSTVQWIDPAGRRSPLVPTAAVYVDPRLSPDDGRLLLTVFGQSGPDVAVFDAQRDSVPRKLSFDGLSVDPLWIRKNGDYVAFLNFGRRVGVTGELRWLRTDGGQPQLLLPDVAAISTGSFSAEANRLAFVAVEAPPGGSRGRSSRRNIFTVSITEEAGSSRQAPRSGFLPESSLSSIRSFHRTDAGWRS